MRSALPATVSLDLDNQWAYMLVHGDPGWESFPSYLDRAVPRILAVLREREMTISFFIVGQDAALAKNREAVARIPAAGHDIANHSFHHLPSIAQRSPQEIDAELARAEDAIEAATGQRPTGYRGPGFSISAALLDTLQRRGYRYDASTFPTFIGPLARRFYQSTVRKGAAGEQDRQTLYGRWSDGLRPLRPFRWGLPAGELLEIPVTTFPLLRTPIHLTYLLFLLQRSRALALSYFRNALRLCGVTGVAPSLLLHPLDFLGGDDVPQLKFFPGMSLPGEVKTAFVADVLAELTARFAPLTMRQFAEACASEERNLERVLPRRAF